MRDKHLEVLHEIQNDLHRLYSLFNEVRRDMDWLRAAVAHMHREGEQIMGDINETITEILAEVNELPTIEASLDALFAQLAILIESGKTDPAKLQQAKELLVAHKEHLKADIVANTPAAP